MPSAPLVALLLLGACSDAHEFKATVAEVASGLHVNGFVDDGGAVELQVEGGARLQGGTFLCAVFGDDLRAFMDSAELLVYSRGGYSGGSPAIGKGNGSPAGCLALRVGAHFAGTLRSLPSSPPEPPPDQETVSFRIVDGSGTFSIDVASPTAMRSVSLAAPVGRPITVGERVTLQWQPATDLLEPEMISYCTSAPPSNGIPNPCLLSDGTVTPFETAKVDPKDIAGSELIDGGPTSVVPTTMTFPMPDAPGGDGRFNILNPLVQAGVVGCPFGKGCSFLISGPIVPTSLDIAASVAQ